MADSANHPLTAETLLDGARMYAAAADAVNDRFPNAFHVLSHLLGMSIELALKAYLRQHGASESDLKRHGHDLKRLLDAAIAAGLNYSGSRNFVLTVTSEVYKHRVFAYPENGVVNAITPFRLRQMARELIEDAIVAIHGADELVRLRDAAGVVYASSFPEEIDPSRWAESGGDQNQQCST